jgi:P pilus assembly chaperone PapD
MNVVIKKVSRFLFTCLVGGWLSVSAATAQQFVVSPLVTITGAVSGQSKGSINITNKGQEPLRVRVYAESFEYDKRKGFLFTPADERSAVKYLQFSPREMEVPPGVTRSVRVAVTLPPSALNQEYRAAIFVEDLKERQVNANNGNVLSIKSRVASVFFLSKGSSSPDIQATGAVWDASSKRLRVLLENKGSQTAYPEFNWRIERNNQEVAKDVVRGVIVQSNNAREIELQSSTKPVSLTSGDYTLSGTILTTGKKPTPFSIRVSVP